MENAVQALLIAAGVLIGVMILTLAVSLYSSLGSYVETTQKSITDKQIQQFNSQFTKYINCNATGDIEFTLTIQDIVTAANIAYENNLEHGLEVAEENNFYVTINMQGRNNVQQSVKTDMVTILKDGYEKEYKCSTTDIKINPTTGRVCEVNFKEK